MIKYILCPGYILSEQDGQRHWISAVTLARLYKVPLNECYVLYRVDDNYLRYGLTAKERELAITLRPLRSGKYEETKALQEKAREETLAKQVQSSAPVRRSLRSLWFRRNSI